MISAIVCVDENWGIGYNGELLERIPEDMKRFKEFTINHMVVMGRKTWDSLLNKPLPNRVNIIITNDKNFIRNNRVSKEEWFKGTSVNSCNLDTVKIGLETLKNEEWFIIGGGSIYKELLPYCDIVHLTRIHKEYENVDTYFPKLEKNEWECIECSELNEYKDISYSFETYKRI